MKRLVAAALIAGSLVGVGSLPAQAEPFRGKTIAATSVATQRSRNSNVAITQVISDTDLNSLGNFSAKFNDGYPWGDDHNGSAKMVTDQRTVSNGVLTLRASRVTGQGNSTHDPYLPIQYFSAAAYAKDLVNVSATNPSWYISADIKTSTKKGMWPAFWLTPVVGWPPEIDIVEFPGTSTAYQTTHQISLAQAQHTKAITRPDTEWHNYAVYLSLSGSNVVITYYIDGKAQATDTGTGFANKGRYLILNLQTGGWAGGAEVPEAKMQIRHVNMYKQVP